MVKAKPEKFALEGITINDLIKEDFLEKLKKREENIFPISLVFLSEKSKEKMKLVSPLILSHQSNEEINNKILHIESPDSNLVESLKEILENN